MSEKTDEKRGKRGKRGASRSKRVPRKAIREVGRDRPPRLRGAIRSLAEFRRECPETAPNRYALGPTADPVEIALPDGSRVTKSRTAALVVECGDSAWRVEMRSR